MYYIYVKDFFSMNQRKQSNQYTFPVLFDTINFQMYLFEDLKKITGISNFPVLDFFL